jgi:hypothetical protein
MRLHACCQRCNHDHDISLSPLVDYGCGECSCASFSPPEHAPPEFMEKLSAMLANGTRIGITEKGMKAGLSADALNKLLSPHEKD